jgi:hypothetical protein
MPDMVITQINADSWSNKNLENSRHFFILSNPLGVCQVNPAYTRL